MRRTTGILCATVLLGALATAGCGTVDGTRQAMDRARLVDELAQRLDNANTAAFAARYRLAGGETATIAQARKPARQAYRYPGGQVVISSTATAECTGAGAEARCTLTPAPLSTDAPPADALAAAREQGVVYPVRVMGLLTAAALDRDATVDRSDATIAGQRATCVDASHVAGADPPAFHICVTAAGVLGSFRGDLDGRPVDVVLTRYEKTAPESMFDLPAGATVTDRRRS